MQKQLGAAAFDTPCELVKRSNGMLTSYDQFCCSNKAKVSFTTSATQSNAKTAYVIHLDGLEIRPVE